MGAAAARQATPAARVAHTHVSGIASSPLYSRRRRPGRLTTERRSAVRGAARKRRPNSAPNPTVSNCRRSTVYSRSRRTRSSVEGCVETTFERKLSELPKMQSALT